MCNGSDPLSENLARRRPSRDSLGRTFSKEWWFAMASAVSVNTCWTWPLMRRARTASVPCRSMDAPLSLREGVYDSAHVRQVARTWPEDYRLCRSKLSAIQRRDRRPPDVLNSGAERRWTRSTVPGIGVLRSRLPDAEDPDRIRKQLAYTCKTSCTRCPRHRRQAIASSADSYIASFPGQRTIAIHSMVRHAMLYKQVDFPRLPF